MSQRKFRIENPSLRQGVGSWDNSVAFSKNITRQRGLQNLRVTNFTYSQSLSLLVEIMLSNNEAEC